MKNLLFTTGGVLIGGGLALALIVGASPELRASYGSLAIAGAILWAAVYIKEDW